MAVGVSSLPYPTLALLLSVLALLVLALLLLDTARPRHYPPGQSTALSTPHGDLSARSIDASTFCACAQLENIPRA